MASKTALPIARLRSLGCKVSTVLGHDVPSPVSGRHPGVTANWRYAISLPAEIAANLHATDVTASNGRATAYWHDVSARIIVEGRDVEQPSWREVVRQSGARVEHLRRDSLTAKVDRELVEARVAGLLNSIADTLSKA